MTKRLRTNGLHEAFSKYLFEQADGLLEFVEILGRFLHIVSSVLILLMYWQIESPCMLHASQGSVTTSNRTTSIGKLPPESCSVGDCPVAVA